jgi:thioredoxin-related protein
MRKISAFLLILLLLATFSSTGQTGKPDSAQNIINSALAEARASKKNIFIVFSSTWCKWCKRLEAVLESPEIKPIIDKNYVFVKLDVKEQGEKIQTHENPGGAEMLDKFDGTDSGIPFYVFLNEKGKMIANSNVMPKNQNLGYPGSKKEIAAFIRLLKKTSFLMTDKECNKISKYLKNNAPK